MDETCKNCVELGEAIDAVRVIGEASESLDAQQKKAKAFAFDSLDEASCFWLKDNCQRIMPMKFHEDQLDYFWKRGTILHVDIIFTMMT